MKAAEGTVGRIFILRLEDGDVIPDCIEEFATEKSIKSGFCWFLGGIGSGKLVVGPQDDEERPIIPMIQDFQTVHEAIAFGTIFMDEENSPRLHLHASLGRENYSLTGCAREGIRVWQICEALIIEGIGLDMTRKTDPDTGFSLLSPK